MGTSLGEEAVKAFDAIYKQGGAWTGGAVAGGGRGESDSREVVLSATDCGRWLCPENYSADFRCGGRARVYFTLSRWGFFFTHDAPQVPNADLAADTLSTIRVAAGGAGGGSSVVNDSVHCWNAALEDVCKT